MPHFQDDLYLGNAPTYQGVGRYPQINQFLGSVSSTTMTITSLITGGPVTIGMLVAGTGVTANSVVTAFGTGTGGAGTYTLSQSSSSTGAITITGTGDQYTDDSSKPSMGLGPLGRTYIWDEVPYTLSLTNVSAAASYAGAGAMTLAAGAGTTLATNAKGESIIQLDCARALCARVGAGTPVTANVTITGYDYYGQKMSEVIATGTTQNTTVNGKKAFYQVLSAAISGNPSVQISLGTTDIIGIPLKVVDAGYIIHVGWNNTLARDTGTLVTAVSTNPATSTTGDVRGTYTLSSASDGNKRLVMVIGLTAMACGPNSTRFGALGVNQDLS